MYSRSPCDTFEPRAITMRELMADDGAIYRSILTGETDYPWVGDFQTIRQPHTPGEDGSARV